MDREEFVGFVDRSADNCDGVLVIGIDGRCAAGKSTVSALLGVRLGAAVIPMDSFFIPAARRGSGNFAVPGENFDRERFVREVMPQLEAVKCGRCREISYVPFDCRTQRLLEPVVQTTGRIVVVEGSYCLHPELRHIYDIKVFCDVSPDEQLRRLVSREGCVKAAEFTDRWIPLEELYFADMDIKSAADIILELR